MITNFEEITEDLTDLEREYLPDVEKALANILTTKQNLSTELIVLLGKFPKPIKQAEIVKQLNANLIAKHGLFCQMRLNTVRLRKYFNYFRTNGILPIVATSDGCYITTDKEEIEKQIKSLSERANQIQRAAEGLKKFLI